MPIGFGCSWIVASRPSDAQAAATASQSTGRTTMCQRSIHDRCRAARWASIGSAGDGMEDLGLRRPEPGAGPGRRQHEHPRSRRRHAERDSGSLRAGAGAGTVGGVRPLRAHSSPPGRLPTMPSATNSTDRANAAGAATPAARRTDERRLAGAEAVDGDRQQHHQQDQRDEGEVGRERRVDAEAEAEAPRLEDAQHLHADRGQRDGAEHAVMRRVRVASTPTHGRPAACARAQRQAMHQCDQRAPRPAR